MTQKSTARLLRDQKEKNETPPRAKDVIDKEYAEACGKLGDLDVKLAILEYERDQTKTKLFSLVRENAKAQALEKEKTETTTTETTTTAAETTEAEEVLGV